MRRLANSDTSKLFNLKSEYTTYTRAAYRYNKSSVLHHLKSELIIKKIWEEILLNLELL